MTGRQTERAGSASPPQPQTGVGASVDAGRLFDEHAAFLFRVVERLAGRGDHVEDVVQEVFLTVHRRRHELDGTRDLRGWLYRTASNLVRHHRRGFARRRALADKLERQDIVAEAPRPDAELDRREKTLQVRACIERLPHKQREVFVLFELEGLEGAEIAELLELPENTVWSRLHHARKRFKKAWEAAEKRRRSHATPA